MVWMFDWSIAEVIVEQAQVLRLYGTWSLEQAVEQVVEWSLEQVVEQAQEPKMLLWARSPLNV